MTAHLGMVLHVQVGDGSCYGEFSVPANQASSTWWVAKDGTLEQYVDSDLAAWTEAAGNFTWDSVETEGTPDQALTDAQIVTLAKLYAWGVQTYGWPVRTSEDPRLGGFGWHGMGGAAWGGHYQCPGELRKAQRPAILTLANLELAPPAPPSVPLDPYLEIIMSLANSPADALAVFIRSQWVACRTDAFTVPAQQYLIAGYNGPWHGSLDAVLACIIDTARTQGHLRPGIA